MGEMADYALEMNVYTPDDLGFDGFDSWEADDYGNAICRVKKTLSCKHCGTKKVYWSNTENGWRLFNDETRKIHSCPGFGGRK